MAAIFGFISKNGKSPDPEISGRMERAMPGRTTAGTGVVRLADAVFGACATGAHSLQSDRITVLETGELVLVADIRIDNRGELVRVLGEENRSAADQVLILKAWQRWGADFCDHIQGEFTVAIWEKASRQFWLFTDPVGFRPVYYYDDPELFVFCSDPNGVLAVKPGPHYFNEDYMIAYFMRQADSAVTCTRGVRYLPAAQRLRLQGGKISVERYWIAARTGKYHFKKNEDWHACLKELIWKEVEHRLDTDGEVGIALSGGLDSSAIACIAAKILEKKNKPLFAFSSVLPQGHQGTETDERRYIEMVSRQHPNIIQFYVDGTETGLFDHAERLPDEEHLFPAPFAYIDDYMLGLARQKNVGTFLSGQGGDIWPSWYGTGVVYQLLREGNYKKAMGLMKQFSERDKRSLPYIIAREYFGKTKWARAIRDNWKYRKSDWQLKPGLKTAFASGYVMQIKRRYGESHLEGMLRQLNNGMTGKLLQLYVGRSEKYGIGTAMPLIAKPVLEFMMDVPQELFVAGGFSRSLFRNAMAGILPEEIRWRKDKHSYAPGYMKALGSQKHLIRQAIHNPEHAFIFEKYLDKELYEQQYQRAGTATTYNQRIFHVRLAQMVICCIGLNRLKQKGYLFGK